MYGNTRVARRDNGISPRNDDILTRSTSRLEELSAWDMAVVESDYIYL